MSLTEEFKELKMQKEMIIKDIKNMKPLVYDMKIEQPLLESEIKYFEELGGKKYPNVTFLKHTQTIRQSLAYFELKDKLHKATEMQMEKYSSMFPLIELAAKEEAVRMNDIYEGGKQIGYKKGYDEGYEKGARDVEKVWEKKIKEELKTKQTVIKEELEQKEEVGDSNVRNTKTERVEEKKKAPF